MTIKLSVNLNKIALIRNSREGNYPNVSHYAERCLNLGAQGLTAHPRPDQRHMRPSDVVELSRIAASREGIEFNIEGNPFAPPLNDYPGLLALVEQTKPAQCTLVPDSDSQKTSDHGFNLSQDAEVLAPLIQRIQALGTRVSLFMDPDPAQMALAKECGADRIELYTGPYAWSYSKAYAPKMEGMPKDRSEDKLENINVKELTQVFDQHVKTAEEAIRLNLGINAGHDLNLDNLKMYKSLPGLQEVSIGHALTVDALNMGFDTAIGLYLSACKT